MKFSFASLHATRSYWVILALFAAANLWSWLRHRPGDAECCDRLIGIGFPFPFHVSGGIAGRDDLLVTGLLLDLVIAWTCAVLGTWIALSWRNRRRSSTGRRG